MKFPNQLIVVLLGIVMGILMALFVYSKVSEHNMSKVLITPTSIPAVTPTQHTSLSRIKHVFIIVEENHDWSMIKGNTSMPYLNNTLLTKGAFASQYYNVPKNATALHPSEPNYILLEAGKTDFTDHTFTTDSIPSPENSTASKDHLVTLLDKQGLTWKSYQEDITGTICPINSVGKYAPKHNPSIFFQDVSGNPPSTNSVYCKNHIRPFSELQADLISGNIPNYVYITPNLDHDMHDGTPAKADSWLSQVIPMITSSQSFKKDGALFITWDEGSDVGNGNNPIGMIVLSPFIKQGYTNTTSYSHVSYLKTIQEIFNLSPLLGGAADPSTQDLSGFFIH